GARSSRAGASGSMEAMPRTAGISALLTACLEACNTPPARARDILDSNAIISFHHHNFAPRDDGAVDCHIHRFAEHSVELDDGSGGQPQQLAKLQPGTSERYTDRQIDIEECWCCFRYVPLRFGLDGTNQRGTQGQRHHVALARVPFEREDQWRALRSGGQRSSGHAVSRYDCGAGISENSKERMRRFLR